MFYLPKAELFTQFNIESQFLLRDLYHYFLGSTSNGKAIFSYSL